MCSLLGSGVGLREVSRCRLAFRAAQSPQVEVVEGQLAGLWG